MLYLCDMKKNNEKNKAKVSRRPIEIYFEDLDNTFTGNKVIYAVFLALLFFGVMGLIWMIPFPQFQFLIKHNMQTFLNWGSFFIAIVVYSYLKLATTLSYAALMCISVMSFFIVQLEYVEMDGGPSVVLVCSIIVLLSGIGLFLTVKNEKSVTLQNVVKFLTLGPIWLWSKVYNRFNIKY